MSNSQELNNTPQEPAKVRVSDARKAAQSIAENALTPAELNSLSNDEVWLFEQHIAELYDLYRPGFARLDKQLQATVTAVFAAVKDEADVRRARTDSNFFMEYVFTDDVSGEPVKQADIHRRWHNTMSTQKQALLIGPREHGKSTQVVGYALWKLGNNTNLRIKVISNTDSEAIKRIGEMQQHIEFNPRYKRVFPDVKPAERGNWNSQKFFVQRARHMREPSVEGYGVMSSGTGGRADIIILDDVVDRKNALTQPSLRKVVKEAVQKDWLALLSDGGQVIGICTLWHKDDLNVHLGGNALKSWLRHNEGKGDPPDQTGLLPGEWFVSFDAVGPNYESVWPEYWTTEKLQAVARRVGRSAFNRGYRNRILDDEETMIDPDWIVYYKRGSLPPRDRLFVLQSYDLAIAGKKGKGKSYFACTTLGALFQPDKTTIYIIDAFRRKANFPEQLALVKQGFVRVMPHVILLESVAYQAALYQQLLDTTILPVVPVNTKGISKELRLESASPAIEGGNVIFSERLNPESNYTLERRGDLVSELLDFPFGETDDMVDTLSQGIRYVQEYAATLQANGSLYAVGEANVYMLDGELDNRTTMPDTQDFDA